MPKLTLETLQLLASSVITNLSDLDPLICLQATARHANRVPLSSNLGNKYVILIHRA